MHSIGRQKSTRHHYVRPIWTKFVGHMMQNCRPITVIWSKSKPEEFQYGGLLFYQTGSSYISAVDWAILTKSGMLKDFELLKIAMSPNPKPEVRLRRYTAAASWKSIRSHNFSEHGPIWKKTTDKNVFGIFSRPLPRHLTFQLLKCRRGTFWSFLDGD